VDGSTGTSCNGSNSTACLTYNALGQQVEQVGATWRWVFPYGLGGEKLGWFNGTGGYFSRYHVYAARQEIRLYASNTRYYYHHNPLGSAGMVTDQAGAAVGERLYYPWGDSWATGGAAVSKRFAAMLDAVPGTADAYTTLFRHYLPGQFRWLSPDPLAGDILNPQSLNRYAYVLNNPINLIDPLGLAVWDGHSDCRDAWYSASHAECQDPGPCIAPGECRNPIPFPFPGPGGHRGGHGGGGGGGGNGGTQGGNTPGTGGNPPTPGTTQEPPIDIPDVIKVTSVGVLAGEGLAALVCGPFAPICEAVVAGALVGAAVGYTVATVQNIYESRRVSPNQAENEMARRIARQFCVDPHALRDASHDYKKRYGGWPLTQEEIEDLARNLPKLPGCTQTKW
jgi:RHS repeat-associated protein